MAVLRKYILTGTRHSPDTQGMGIAVVDGHESHTSYLQHCSGCLERTMHLETGDRIQFYHRQGTLMFFVWFPSFKASPWKSVTHRVSPDPPRGPRQPRADSPSSRS